MTRPPHSAAFLVVVGKIEPRPALAPGSWHVTVYADDEHIRSTESGVPLSTGLAEATQAMREWLVDHGMLDPVYRDRFSTLGRRL